ncbi:MAG: NAD-dependent epimerase/dehydratase family protein [Candidatus Omnitrophota bacterium]|jgi:nucleoside-diphosphate-sugar epimerase
MRKKIAILGATSHIAKGLILNFLKDKKNSLFLFARSPFKVASFLKENAPGAGCGIDGFKGFGKGKYDVIINCVGLGTPSKVIEANNSIFNLTEKFDNLALGYLKKYPKAIYINFSSGAVYTISCGDLKPEHYYGVAKLWQEARHRALNKLNIVDIRVFSYFSRFIDMDSGYFITELLKSLKKNKVFLTNTCDFSRDFLSPGDLFRLISLIIKTKPFNGVVDAYSAKPVNKFKLLDYFSRNHSLKYDVIRELEIKCPTGVKEKYFPVSKRAADLGYRPEFSSLKTITSESRYILGTP